MTAAREKRRKALPGGSKRSPRRDPLPARGRTREAGAGTRTGTRTRPCRIARIGQRVGVAPRRI